MSRLAYAILGALLAGLLAYLFWPQGRPADPWTVLWPGKGAEPARFTLHAGGMEQVVSPETVRIRSIDLRADPERARTLWGVLAGARAPASRTVAGVAEAQLAAYGIDGSRRVSAEGVDLRWGSTADQGHLWNGTTRVLGLIGRPAVASIDRAAGRMDRTVLIDAAAMTRIVHDGLALRREAGGWMAEGAGHRPSFDRRVQRLAGLIGGLTIVRFDTAPVAEAPFARIVIHTAAGSGSAGTHAIALSGADSAGQVQVDGLPPQPLSARELATWRLLLGELAEDHPCDVLRDLGGEPPAEVTVQRDGGEWFRLVRRDSQSASQSAGGTADWDVVWSGGRESADPDGAALLCAAMDDLVVADVSALLPIEQPPQRGLRIAVSGAQRRGVAVLAIDGDTAWTAQHRGRIVRRVAPLADIAPDRFLSLRLCPVASERLVKVQRIVADEQPERREVFTAGDGGWAQTFPAGARPGTDLGAAVTRLARALTSAAATQARLLTDEDRAVLASPAFELDVRIAPAIHGRAGKDDTDLADTTMREAGFAGRREPSGRWRLVAKDAGISYAVDDEVVDALRAPLVDRLVMPLVPALVRTATVTTAGGRYRLERSGDGWTAMALPAADAPGGAPVDATEAPAPAAPIEVSRWFRALAGLRALRSEPLAVAFAEGDGAATIVCEMTGAGAGERLTLVIGDPVGGEVAASSWSDRAAPGGRLWLSAADAAAVVRPLASFIATETR